MKYRVICMLLAFVMAACLFSGCQSEEPAKDPTTTVQTTPTQTAPETTVALPSYDAAPAQADAAVTVDGQTPENIFTDGQTLYLRLDGADIQTTQGAAGETTARGTDLFYGKGTFEEKDLLMDNETAAFTLDGTAVETKSAPLFDGESWYLPLCEYYTACGYTVFDDEEQSHLYYTMSTDATKIPNGYSVPVLMYHAVSDNCWGIEELFVSPSSMEAQLKYLNENGYTTIWFSDLEHIDQIEKPVMLTFDDGYDDNYEYLFPLLKEYNCKATIFVIPTAIGGNHKMNAEQIKEMSDSGLVDIESHTMTHPDLDTLGYDDTIYELEQSRLEILRITGKLPYVLCYPTGYNSSITREVAKDYYQFGILMNGGRYTTGTDLYLIPRHYVSRYTDIGSFASLISQY